MFVKKGVLKARTQDVTAGHNLAYFDTLVGLEQPGLVEVKSRYVSTFRNEN